MKLTAGPTRNEKIKNMKKNKYVRDRSG